MSADLVKELREKTGAGFMDCKKALTESGNDLEKATEYLRKKGLASAAKKAGREMNDGRVFSYVHATGKIGVLVEVNCETDFVAKTDDFVALASNLAMQVAAANPRFVSKDTVPAEEASKIPAAELDSVCLLSQQYVKDPGKTVEDLVKETIAKLGENIGVKRFARFQLGEK